MEYEAFVYKWINTDTGKYYIGKHKGIIDDGYISSGKAFLQVYNSNPNLFKRVILFKGTHEEVCKLEQECIKEAIKEVGYKGIYNLTTWNYLNEWKRTCLHCGSIVDPRNEEWVKVFEYSHFENCKMNPANIKVKKEKKVNPNIQIRSKPIWPRPKPKIKTFKEIDTTQLAAKEKQRLEYILNIVKILELEKKPSPRMIKSINRLKIEITELTGIEHT
jgi:hypothetical protein